MKKKCKRSKITRKSSPKHCKPPIGFKFEYKNKKK